MSAVILAMLWVGLLGALLRQVGRRRAHAAVLRRRLDEIRHDRELEAADARGRAINAIEWGVQWSA